MTAGKSSKEGDVENFAMAMPESTTRADKE
jgi:hypothetical protein